LRISSPQLAALALLAAALAAPSRSARASDLVGAESCRTCHAEAYRVWSQSAHAHADSTLTGAQRQQQLCLYCHSRDEARSGAAQVTGVSCETCHGGGRYYQPAVVMRDKELARLFGLTDLTAQTAAASCLGCHSGETPSLKAFDVKEALTRIDHWTADRAARKAARSARRSPHARPSVQLAQWLREAPPQRGAP
jgi:hypothetical protein